MTILQDKWNALLADKFCSVFTRRLGTLCLDKTLMVGLENVLSLNIPSSFSFMFMLPCQQTSEGFSRIYSPFPQFSLHVQEVMEESQAGKLGSSICSLSINRSGCISSRALIHQHTSPSSSPTLDFLALSGAGPVLA